MKEQTLTLTFYDNEIDLLQASADEMTAWCAAQGRPEVWTLEKIVHVNALVMAKEEAQRRAKKAR